MTDFRYRLFGVVMTDFRYHNLFMQVVGIPHILADGIPLA